VLVHGHFYYPDLLAELAARLSANRYGVDLWVTTDTAEKANAATAVLEASGPPTWRVEIVPNRGRDLGPLLAALPRAEMKQRGRFASPADAAHGAREAGLEHYDLLLHVHGKRSPLIDADVAERWREFLWENLVGGRHAMLDVTVAAFATDPRLGLVYPDDTGLNDWDGNRAYGSDLAARLGLRTGLTTHFDFPVGTMFWARPAALAPLFEAGFTWDDFPEEPLPSDGTVLHALERIVPFVVEDQGYSQAKTAVPGVMR
jgi:lipopolysaccharide biosynthesis protein